MTRPAQPAATKQARAFSQRPDSRPSISPYVVRLGCFVLACGVIGAHAGLCSAQEVAISRLDCSRGIHIVAHHVPASEVLKKLALELGFQLTLEKRPTSVANLDTDGPVYELLTEMLKNENVIIVQRRDVKCPGKLLVSRVWVLQKNASSSPVTSLPKGSKPAPVPITAEAREQDELYQRAHGMMPELSPSAPSK